MKILREWTLAVLLFGLLFLGATDVSEMLLHFHHNDHEIPAAIGIAINGALIPLGIGVLIAACVKRELLGSPWPLLLAPSLLFAFQGYAMESFYRPYTTEALTLILLGATEGVMTTLGWLAYRRFSDRYQIPVAASR